MFGKPVFTKDKALKLLELDTAVHVSGSMFKETAVRSVIARGDE